MINQYLKIHPEIQEAIDSKKPIVALESTIISHGMPYPQNIETALSVENEVRKIGAIPATIAIKDGQLLVGLSADDIDYFGNASDVWKVSLRDMPYVVAMKKPGATTVAATMRIASMAGIAVFATGGIGGVHRGANESMDISADLTEMGNTNVAVISAGVKSILDIGLTLEYLETLGIPVVTYNQPEFPSFYSSKSGFESPLQLNSAAEIAQMMKTKWDLGIAGSVMVANPISKEHEVPQEIVEQHILQALNASKIAGITGKKVTPFLLKYIAENTKGESLSANISLIHSNANLAAQIAVAYRKL